MTKYEMRKLLRRAKGTILSLPEIVDSAASRSAYLKVLRKMLRGIIAAAREVTDRGGLERVAVLALALAVAAEKSVEAILTLEARRHTAAFRAGVKRTTGIDLAAVVRDEDLTEHLRLASARNASLIRNLSADAVKRVQQVVLDGLINGASVAFVQKALTVEFGFTDRRAKLIARDQMAKLNSDLNRIRHQQAGVNEYSWATAQDERVRKRHAALEGIVYRYGETTGAEDGLPPGQPINCRCVARGIVRF